VIRAAIVDADVLKPIVEFFLNPWNAPIWIAIGALVFGGVWLYERRGALRTLAQARLQSVRARAAPTAPKADLAAPPYPPPLSTADVALIERVLDACSELLVEAVPLGLDDARVMLRAALANYLRDNDPKGRRVATLLADRHFHEAQDLAVAIAGDLTGVDAARAWLDASAVSAMNDARAAIIAAEKARELGDAHAVSLAWLGRLYLRRGRLGEAEAAFKGAEAAFSHDEKVKRAGIFAFRAEIAIKWGDRPSARSLLELALGAFSDAGNAGAEGASDVRARLAKLAGSSATGDEN
jgi:tetratricopeptide (TPR) repeat protein